MRACKSMTRDAGRFRRRVVTVRCRRGAARNPVDEAKVEAARQTMRTALERLERRLNEAEWLGGSSYSLADVAAAPFIDRLEELNLSGLWATHSALKNWIARTKARPAYREAVPDNSQRFVAAYRFMEA